MTDPTPQDPRPYLAVALKLLDMQSKHDIARTRNLGKAIFDPLFETFQGPIPATRLNSLVKWIAGWDWRENEKRFQDMLQDCGVDIDKGRLGRDFLVVGDEEKLRDFLANAKPKYLASAGEHFKTALRSMNAEAFEPSIPTVDKAPTRVDGITLSMETRHFPKLSRPKYALILEMREEAWKDSPLRASHGDPSLVWRIERLFGTEKERSQAALKVGARLEQARGGKYANSAKYLQIEATRALDQSRFELKTR